VVIAMGVLSYSTIQSMVGPVLTTLRQEYGTSPDAITWVVTAYLLSASVFTPIAGRAGDIFGKQRMFVIALLLLAVGSLVAALASNFGLLIVGRLVQGTGGGTLPLGFGIVRDVFPGKKVAAAVGSLASLTAVGGGLGSVLAGPIVRGLGTAWLFWLPMIVTAAAAAGAYVFIPPSPPGDRQRIGIRSAVLLSAWLTALLLGVSQAPQWGWLSPATIALLVAACVIFGVWAGAERRSTSPLIDVRLMSRRPVLILNLVALLVGFGIYSYGAFVPEYLQSRPGQSGFGFGLSITESGLILIPSAVTNFVVGSYYGRLADRYGAKRLMVLGCVCSGVSVFMVAALHHYLWQFSIAAAVLGVGFGLSFAAMSGLIVEVVKRTETGVAAGMNANIRTIGGAVGAAVVSTVIADTSRSSGMPTGAGYLTGFAVIGFGMLAAAAAATLFRGAPDVSPLPLPSPLPRAGPEPVEIDVSAAEDTY
jgi:MFS family permease